MHSRWWAVALLASCISVCASLQMRSTHAEKLPSLDTASASAFIAFELFLVTGNTVDMLLQSKINETTKQEGRSSCRQPWVPSSRIAT